MEAQIAANKLPMYRKCRGSWRPDFLVEDSVDENGMIYENYRITEINARFSFNAFILGTLAHEALQDMGLGNNGLKCATDPVEVMILETISQPRSEFLREYLLTLRSYSMERSAYSIRGFHCTY